MITKVLVFNKVGAQRYKYISAPYLLFLGVSNLGLAYIPKHLQIQYQTFGKDIPNFQLSQGVSNLGLTYILIRLQTPNQVFRKETQRFWRSLGVTYLG